MKFTAGPLSFYETVAFDPMSIVGAVAAPIVGSLSPVEMWLLGRGA